MDHRLSGNAATRFRLMVGGFYARNGDHRGYRGAEMRQQPS
jgi:hypothetical protein